MSGRAVRQPCCAVRITGKGESILFMYRAIFLILLCFTSALFPAQAAAATAKQASASAPALNAPLPDPEQLLARALANEKKIAAEQERYDCRVTDVITQTDKNGKVKKVSTEVRQQFFVNGIPIERILSKNGKALSPGEEKKQNQRVMKETLKYSNQAAAQKETNEQNRQVQDFLAAMMLTDGRREIENGRSVLYYTIVPNPKFRAKNLYQRFAKVMRGTVSIDERTGEIIDFNVKSVANLKLGGGLLANIHKGLWVHVHNQEQPDGVWLADLAEGSGSASALFFFHPYFQFKETTGDCRLYTTSAQQVGQAKPVN